MPFAAAAGKRLVGPAFTLRFVPVREDLATPESWAKPISTRGAIEDMPEGCIAVADAMGVTSAGIFGDILTMRMMKRNVTALVTDGVIRDKAGVLASKLPVWCAGVAAPASVNGLTFVGWQEPIGCGGCAIFPDDVIVCDDDAVCEALSTRVTDIGTPTKFIVTSPPNRKFRSQMVAVSHAPSQ
jgi:regulator of RNase E activity RraA